MDLTTITDDALSTFADNFPEYGCVGIRCDDSCPHYKEKLPNGNSAIRCNDVWKYLLPEAYRRGIIAHDEYVGKLKEANGE